MARHSEVLIQGTNVPGGSFKVNVPVDSSYASDAARNIYPYDGAQYIWVKSWETGQSSSGGSGGSGASASGGNGCLVLLGLGFIIIFGGVVGTSDDNTPTETPQAAPVERVQAAPAPVAPTAEPQFRDYASPPPSYCITENFEPC